MARSRRDFGPGPATKVEPVHAIGNERVTKSWVKKTSEVAPVIFSGPVSPGYPAKRTHRRQLFAVIAEYEQDGQSAPEAIQKSRPFLAAFYQKN
jgi:hypothetical protein